MFASRIALAAGVLAGLLRLALIWSGWCDTSVVADDAYYYFTIAKHLAQGLGPTFDGLAPTNGFHPLWQLLLVPLWWIWPHDLWTPVRAALTLSSVFDLATGWLLYRWVARRAGARAAAASAIIWLLAPHPLFMGLRGMEASVNAFLVVLLLSVVDGMLERPLRGRDAVVAGLLLGLAGLARTDNLGSLGLALALGVFSGAFTALERTRQRLTWLAAAAVTCLAAMLPWFLWNLTRFGSILQVSGQVKLHTKKIVGFLPSNWSTPSGIVEAVAHRLFAPVLLPLRYFAGEEFLDARWFPVLAVAVLVLGLLLLTGAWRAVRERRPAERTWIIVPLSYLVIHMVLFGVVWRSYSGWYAQPVYALLAVALGLAVMRLAFGTRADRLLLASTGTGLLVSLAIAMVLFATRVDHTPKRPEARFVRVIDRCIAALPGGRGTIGAFDAGAVGYVATEVEGITVVNLDCLVNNAAYDALRAGRYPEYVVRTVDVFIQPIGRTRMFLDRSEYARLLHLLGRNE